MQETPGERTRQPVSVAIITLNEERNIGECLESVKWADEIVVVDSFSSDRTVEICREFGAKVWQRQFDGYASQRNHALDKVANDWVLFVDADERCTPDLAASIGRVLICDHPADGYFAIRRNRVFGKWFRGGGHQNDRQVRLFRKDKAQYGTRQIHEIPEGLANVGTLEGELLHVNYRDVGEYIQKMNRYTYFEALEVRKQGVAVGWNNLTWYFFLKPLLFFLLVYVVRKGYVDGLPGFVYSLLSGFYVFVKYAKAWELQRQTFSGDHNESQPR